MGRGGEGVGRGRRWEGEGKGDTDGGRLHGLDNFLTEVLFAEMWTLAYSVQQPVSVESKEWCQKGRDVFSGAVRCVSHGEHE